VALGSTVPSFSGADGNGDGVVSQLDYDVWRLNFGRAVPPAGSGSVVGSGLVALSSSATSLSSGTLTLSGSSSFNGTSLSAGSLTVSSGLVMTSGSGSGTVMLANPANVLLFQPAVVSIPDVIQAAGVLYPSYFTQMSSGGVLSLGSGLAFSLNNVSSRTLEQGGTIQLLSGSNEIAVADGSVQVNSVPAVFGPMFTIGQSPFSNSDSIELSTLRTANPESDLGLLAWLENSPQTIAPGEEWGDWETESGASTSNEGDGADFVDAAFAALEDSALVGATI